MFSFMFGENSVSKEEKFTRTSRVGVTKVRQGFSMPPYGKDGGKTNKSYCPHTYGPPRSSAILSIDSVWKINAYIFICLSHYNDSFLKNVYCFL